MCGLQAACAQSVPVHSMVAGGVACRDGRCAHRHRQRQLTAVAREEGLYLKACHMVRRGMLRPPLAVLRATCGSVACLGSLASLTQRLAQGSSWPSAERQGRGGREGSQAGHSQLHRPPPPPPPGSEGREEELEGHRPWERFGGVAAPRQHSLLFLPMVVPRPLPPPCAARPLAPRRAAPSGGSSRGRGPPPFAHTGGMCVPRLVCATGWRGKGWGRGLPAEES